MVQNSTPRPIIRTTLLSALNRKDVSTAHQKANIRIKYFLETRNGNIVEPVLTGDTWLDIPDAMHFEKSERTGYPTQKPLALLYRIIKASSNEGDIVFDPFCG